MRANGIVWAAMLVGGCTAVVVDPLPDAGVTDAGVSIALLNSGATRLSEAICEYRTRCNGLALDMQTCLEALANEPSTFGSPEAMVDSVSAGRVAFVESQFGECVRAAANLPCFPLRADPLDIDACHAAFIGLVQEEDRCTTDFACENGLSCVPQLFSGVCAGRCERPIDNTCTRQGDCEIGTICQLGACIRANAGGGLDDPCGSYVECALGLQCVQISTLDFRCRPLGGDGVACRLDAGIQCRNGLSCVTAAGQQVGRCRPFAIRGDVCVDTFQCGGAESSLICEPLSGLCIDRPSYGPCLFAGGMAVCNPLDAYCDITRVPPECVPLSRVGDWCREDIECGPRHENVSCLRDPHGVDRCTLVERVRCLP